MKQLSRFLVAVVALGALGLLVETIGPSALADQKVDYPEKGKTVTLLVPFSAGGSADLFARAQAGPLEKELGVPVVVANNPAAGGQAGTAAAALAKPDGYTVVMVPTGQFTSYYMDKSRQATYTRKDFRCVAGFSTAPGMIAVKADSPYKNMKDFVEAARANPGKITIGVAGLKGAMHLAMLEMQQLLGAKFAFVTFDGGIKATMALLGGHIVSQADIASGVGPNIKNGTLRGLGVMAKEESEFLPGVQTFQAQGINLVYGNNRSWAVPAGTPKEVVEVLNRAFQKVLASPDVRAKAKELGDELRYYPPQEIESLWAELEPRIAKQLALFEAQ
jgi:tripartite-type tricarboxylate transporter receptor subunit TctC